MEEDRIVKRSGAKPNDLLCVTVIWEELMQDYLFLKEKVTYKPIPNFQPDFSTYEYILERQLKPEAQKETIEWFKENDVLPSSMIDISDGLASETLHLCKSSDVGCELYIEKLPIDYQTVKTLEEFKIMADVGALNGEEDYELLFTADQKDFDKKIKTGEY